MKLVSSALLDLFGDRTNVLQVILFRGKRWGMQEVERDLFCFVLKQDLAFA
jgi:hypothetical protein